MGKLMNTWTFPKMRIITRNEATVGYNSLYEGLTQTELFELGKISGGAELVEDVVIPLLRGLKHHPVTKGDVNKNISNDCEQKPKTTL